MRIMTYYSLYWDPESRRLPCIGSFAMARLRLRYEAYAHAVAMPWMLGLDGFLVEGYIFPVIQWSFLEDSG